MCNIDLEKGKFLSCAMNFRGDVVSTEVYDAINLIKSSNYKFISFA